MAISKNYVRFNNALDLIEEGDVLLFRGNHLFSWFIEKAGEGRYSHVGLATWHNGRRKGYSGESLLEITEFKEWKGGRTVDFATAYHDSIINQEIDVYRAVSPIHNLKFDPRSYSVIKEEVTLNAKGVTNNLRTLTGLPYGWRRIWWMFRHKAFGFRLFSNLDKLSNDEIVSDPNRIYPVCSTAVAASFSKFGYDLVPNRGDEWCEPSDIARSALLNYLFTLTA